MQRRKWDANTKAMMVLEGLKGKPVAELCAEHQSSQAQYDQWRDQLLAHAPKAFEVHEQSQREARRAREHARVNTLVGELTLELKKATRDWEESATLAAGRAAQRRAARTSPGPEGGAPLLGIPPELGVPALCRAAGGQPETDPAPDAGASPARDTPAAPESQADADEEPTQPHPAERVVGH